MKKNILLITVIMACVYMANAQEFGIGVKAGLSFSSITGDLDPGESMDYKSGFHVGPTFTVRYTDNFGMRAEVLFNQLGASYEYEGPSYFVVRNDSESRPIRGEKVVSYNNFLSYIDIPLQVYYRFGGVLEVYGGANLMLLAGGTAAGRVEFNNRSIRPNDIDVSLDYSYNGDNAGEGSGQKAIYSLGGRTYEVPESIGAYYDLDDKDGRAINTIDYGLHGGLRVLFNDALYLEGRAYIGFNDTTNNDLDLRQYRPENAQLIQRSDDDDRNVAFSASLGFSF